MCFDPGSFIFSPQHYYKDGPTMSSITIFDTEGFPNTVIEALKENLQRVVRSAPATEKSAAE